MAGLDEDREDLGTTTEVYGVDRYSDFPVYVTRSSDTYCSRYEVIPAIMLSPEPWFSYICIGQIAPQ